MVRNFGGEKKRRRERAKSGRIGNEGRCGTMHGALYVSRHGGIETKRVVARRGRARRVESRQADIWKDVW